MNNSMSEGGYGGLSKRERFAGLALQGILSNNDMVRAITQVAKDRDQPAGPMVARTAVAYADALLVELANGGGG